MGYVTNSYSPVDFGLPMSSQPVKPVNATPYSGLGVEDTEKIFDDSYHAANAGYAPFSGDHTGIDRLKGLYDSSGAAFDVSETINAMSKSRESNLLVGEQVANTAASKFAETSGPGGTSAAGAAMVRAKSLLPFLNADSEASANSSAYKDSAKQKALAASADIATKLAQLTESYTNSLASYNSQKANFSLNFATGKTSAAMSANSVKTDFEKFQENLAEQRRQADMGNDTTHRGQDLSAAANDHSSSIQALNSYLANLKAPTGQWTSDNGGHVIGGADQYKAYQDYVSGRSSALDQLRLIGG